MPEIKFYLEVWCSCGEGLCKVTSQHRNRAGEIAVEPCSKCIDRAEEAAHERGRKEGYEEGKKDYQSEEA